MLQPDAARGGDDGRALRHGESGGRRGEDAAPVAPDGDLCLDGAGCVVDLARVREPRAGREDALNGVGGVGDAVALGPGGQSGAVADLRADEQARERELPLVGGRDFEELAGGPDRARPDVAHGEAQLVAARALQRHGQRVDDARVHRVVAILAQHDGELRGAAVGQRAGLVEDETDGLGRRLKASVRSLVERQRARVDVQQRPDEEAVARRVLVQGGHAQRDVRLLER